MFNRFASPYATIVFFALLALYPIQGRFLTGRLDIREMLALALLFMAHLLYVIYTRVRYLAKGMKWRRGSKWSRRAVALNVPVGKAAGMLAGYTVEATDLDGAVFMSRRARPAAILDVALYGLLVVIVLLGGIYNSMHIVGIFEAGQSLAWIDLRTSGLMSYGVFAKKEPLGFLMQIKELETSTSEKTSRVVLEFSDDFTGNVDKKVFERGELKAGDSLELGYMSFRYVGDTYGARLMLYRKDLDCMPDNITVLEGSAGMYKGQFKTHELNLHGEMDYDVLSGLYRVRLYDDEDQVFERQIEFGQVYTDGDYSFFIPTRYHFARIYVERFNYRDEYLLCAVLAGILMIIRLLISPRWVAIWPDGDGTLAYPPRRALKRLARKD